MKDSVVSISVKFGPHWDVQIVGQDSTISDAANILEIPRFGASACELAENAFPSC